LQAAHQDSIHVQAFQVLDRFRRWRVAVLDEDTVGFNQAVVIRGGVPAELFLERRFRLVVAFDGGDAGQCANERANALDEPLWRGEAGLYVDDK
jgi:hypothetical protein